MKIVTRLQLFFLLMLALCLAGAGLSLWSQRQAQHSVERINLAHQVYDGYLSLSSHTYQLFKQYGDTMLVGDRDFGVEKIQLTRRIRGDIARIRQLIGTEIDLVGEEEIEELEFIGAIEVKIEQLVAALDRVTEATEPGDVASRWGELSRILHDDIDRDFHSMIDTALEEEVREVEETRAEVRQRLVISQVLSIVFAASAAVLCALCLVAINRQVTKPAQRLLNAVRRFSDGDLKHRVALPGTDELAEIGRTFDQMAASIAARTASLSSENAQLDQAVRERTAQLERLLEESRRSDQNRRRMLTDVSHELRTPLTIIQGEADIALRGREKSPDVYRDALVRTREAAAHTARIIDDLLFVARNESGEARLVVTDVDLVELSHDVAATYDRSLELVTDLRHAPIRGDAARIRQAVLVLLDNAHHHGGSNVVLRLDHTPGGYRIAVEDDGPGMSDTEKASAFERFFRGSNAARRYGEGLGLGLPIGLAIAEAHGGTITLQDRSGQGLVASILLPRQPKLRAVS
ncbi:MAG: HAMP domain-containing sensor histidine kinase [Pseudomonadota bacterium]